ncbi:hypothetical protein HN020_22950 [Brevibacillus borstelensis]|nr:hypothetical protein [Brevibacillus borstelensis]
MEGCPFIGIMVATRYARRVVLKRYQSHHDLKLKLFAFTPADINWRKRRIRGLSLKGNKWVQRSFRFPKSIINRCHNNRKTVVIQRLQRLIGKHKVFNTINQLNKWSIQKILKESFLQMYVPDMFPFRNANLQELLEKYKLVYIKPVLGSRGKKVHRIERMDNGDTYVSVHSLAPTYIYRNGEDYVKRIKKLIGRTPFIIQQGIRAKSINQRHFDIRVHLQKDMTGNWAVSAIVSRVAHEHYFNTSIYECLYNVGEQAAEFPMGENVLQTLRQISVNAAQMVESRIGLMGELSVDYVMDQADKLWIIELNGNPQKDIYEDFDHDRLTAIVHRRPIEYAYYLAMSRKSNKTEIG